MTHFLGRRRTPHFGLFMKRLELLSSRKRRDVFKQAGSPHTDGVGHVL